MDINHVGEFDIEKGKNVMARKSIRKGMAMSLTTCLLCVFVLLCSGLILAPIVANAEGGGGPVVPPSQSDGATAGGAVDASGLAQPEPEETGSAPAPASRHETVAETNEKPRITDPGPDGMFSLGGVTVTGKIADETTANVPAVVETLTKEGIERINVVDTADVFKYMPGSYLRKLYPGSTNRPLVIRGNNSALTARTLVLMDGIRISDFLAAGHGNAPRWQMVAPEEIEQVDVIYGPFSAEFSGNSMSGTALITTHVPQKMEAAANAKYFYQNFHEYKTDDDLHGYTTYLSFGDKWKDLSYMVWYDRLQAEINPIQYVTREASAGGSSRGAAVTGWDFDKDPNGRDRYILGSPGESDLVNNAFKVKLNYDLTPESLLRFTMGFWDSRQDYDSPESYLRDARGNPVYTGTVNIDGRSYTLGSSTFTYQKREIQDFVYGLTYDLDSPGGLKITGTASAYDKAKDLTRTSSTAPPAAEHGGAGQTTETDAGWYTGDLKAAYDLPWMGVHTVAGGYHIDCYHTDSETWNTSDWKKDTRTSLNQGSEGKTMTNALFIEDTWRIVDKWSVYLGGRYEWWRGFDGSKSTDASSRRVTSGLDDKSEEAFSPKLATTYNPTDDWRLRFSMALAERFPTVGELYYGGINSAGVITNSNPDLKPESVLAMDFTITRFIGNDGEARLTFFQDDVEDAIYSQTNYYTNVTNFQNVDEVRTRGIEVAFNKRRFLIDGLGLFANLAWTDSEILRNDNVPASVGKNSPRVPEWRVKCVLDYAPTDRWFVTFAGHYASEQFGTLDNSDTEGGYGGVDSFLVFDARVSYRLLQNLTAAVGVDNITDELYHVSHPYPRRTVLAELKWVF